MPKPNKVKLVDKVTANFPEELLNSKIWLAYFYQKKKDGTYTKPPCAQQSHTVDSKDLGVTFWDAVKDGYPGIKINEHTDLIAFDIDDKQAKLGERDFDLQNLSEEFIDFMAKYDSYTEISPSGCGLRIIMRCEDKEGLPGRVNLSENLCIGGELFMRSGYVTITGNKIAGETIKTIEKAELEKWFHVAEVIEFPKANDQPSLPTLPTLSIALEALKACSLDQSSIVKKAYEAIISQDYNHYDYWFKIMSACHDYAMKSGKMVEMVSAVVEWSMTDKAAFESEEDVVKHWSSLSSTKTGITYHTLFKFAQMLKFQWPEEAYDKQGNPTGKPLINSLSNFKYLVDYFNIKLHNDMGGCWLRAHIPADKRAEVQLDSWVEIGMACDAHGIILETHIKFETVEEVTGVIACKKRLCPNSNK